MKQQTLSEATKKKRAEPHYDFSKCTGSKKADKHHMNFKLRKATCFDRALFLKLKNQN